MATHEDNPRIITSIKGLNRASRWSDSYDNWLYLGKDINQRERVESILGAESRWILGESLHRVAAELRQPFLDLVADIGQNQSNQIGWWSSTLSWKVWGASDLFLLVCYLGLARSVSQEATSRGNRLMLVVEDFWLLRQFKENYAGQAIIFCDSGSSLSKQKLTGVFQGLLKRVGWLLKSLRNYILQRKAWASLKTHVPTQDSVAIYSYPMGRCLQENGGWQDPFLPQLDLFIQRQGYNVVRFSPPESNGLEGEIAQRQSYFQPLILCANLGIVWRSLTAFWLPRWRKSMDVDGIPVVRLAEREWFTELGRSSLCVYRMFYECLQRMIRVGKWKWIVYPYENQPWEKMISLCARPQGIRTLGIQHSALSIFYLSYFLGAGEYDHMPLPDLILTSGPYPHRLLKEGGNPIERLKMCGSIRYNHLTKSGREEPLASLDTLSSSDILVALPIDIHMTRHLLSAIRHAFPDGGQKDGLRFHIKTHPICPIRPSDVGFAAVEAHTDIYKAFLNCGLVIFVGSTVGPEAVALGLKVLRYRPELLLDVDPAEVFGDDIPTGNDGNIREAVLQLARNNQDRTANEAARSAVGQVFAPLNQELLAEIFHR